MLRIEELEALDLLLWLQSGVTAAEVAGTNQSTICRRAKRALDTFQAELMRERVTWRVETPLAPLLDLQRQIHQQWRFKTGRSLRLNVPSWSRPLLKGCALPGWIISPEGGPLVCENPLALLRGHVIEACLLTPTQLAEGPQADLAVVDLYGSRIDLRLIAGAESCSQAMDSPQAAQDLLAHGCLQLLPFLPSSCRASSRQRLETLRHELGVACRDIAAAPWRQSAAAAQLAFLTPVMAHGLSALRPLPLHLDWPYRESLVVLRSTVDEPAVQVLLESLQRQLPSTLQALVPGETTALL